MIEELKDPNKYSPMELAILKSLKPNRPVGIEHLQNAAYGKVKAAKVPRNWLIIVNAATRRLQDKLQENRETIRIVREKIEGQRAYETTLVKR